MATADDTGTKTRVKRTRTGCFKCRVRRRKCDERKPTCQRCIDGGFDCQYGTKLSFLDKNAITAAGSNKTARQSYSTLRFVDTRPSSAQPPVTSPREAQSTSVSISETTGPSRAAVEAPNGNLAGTSHQDQVVLSDLHPSTSQVEPPQHLRPDIPTPGNHGADASPSNAAYETALHVLLSLGNGNEADHPTPRPREHGTADCFAAYPSHNFAAPAHSGVPDAELMEQFSTCTLLPPDRVVQLLRHYRYNIAPWLDAGDLAQTFGLQVSRLAMGSAPLLESLLALSMTSLNRYAELELKELVQVESDSHEIGLLESIVIIAFAAVRQFAATTPREWQSPFRNIGLPSLNSALAHPDFFSVRLSVSWVLIRLDVSVGLITSSTVSIPNLLPCGVGSPAAWGITREPFKYNREPLLLCAHVINYCFDSDTTHSSGIHLGLGTTHEWKALSEALIMWYNNRPREFKPMLELDDSEQLFPLILFSNGAATLANQMFHTAMLLLLQHRPRTLLNENGRSVTMSPLWHAQRICGISLNNDSRNSWDFSLVGSLYVGAKRMTYEPQQQAILAGIDRIAGITGWQLNALATQLIQEWSPD